MYYIILDQDKQNVYPTFNFFWPSLLKNLQLQNVIFS